MRDHDADGPVVEHRQDAVSVRPRDAHQAGGAEGAGRQQAHVEGDAVPRGVFLVEHDEVEAGAGDDLGIVRAGRLHEGADNQLTGQQAFAESTGVGTDGGHGRLP